MRSGKRVDCLGEGEESNCQCVCLSVFRSTSTTRSSSPTSSRPKVFRKSPSNDPLTAGHPAKTLTLWKTTDSLDAFCASLFFAEPPTPGHGLQVFNLKRLRGLHNPYTGTTPPSRFANTHTHQARVHRPLAHFFRTQNVHRGRSLRRIRYVHWRVFSFLNGAPFTTRWRQSAAGPRKVLHDGYGVQRRVCHTSLVIWRARISASLSTLNVILNSNRELSSLQGRRLQGPILFHFFGMFYVPARDSLVGLPLANVRVWIFNSPQSERLKCSGMTCVGPSTEPRLQAETVTEPSFQVILFTEPIFQAKLLTEPRFQAKDFTEPSFQARLKTEPRFQAKGFTVSDFKQYALQSCQNSQGGTDLGNLPDGKLTDALGENTFSRCRDFGEPEFLASPITQGQCDSDMSRRVMSARVPIKTIAINDHTRFVFFW